MEEYKKRRLLFIQILLFLITIITTTFAGAEYMSGRMIFYGETQLSGPEILAGIYFSLPLLGILTVHELGHFFMARFYRVRVTLPFYIPMWLGFLQIPFSFGTMGAIIRIKDKIQSRKEYFDIGIAGPLAGFVVAIMVLTYGFTHLPEPEYIFEIHPEYQEYGMDYEQHIYDQIPVNFAVGDNLIFLFFKNYVADPERVPNKYEIYHYPWLFAGFLSLFWTALNLLPIGQLDGGHVIYGLFGYKNSRLIFRTLFLILVTVSGIGLLPIGPIDFNFFINAVFYLLFLFLTFHNFERNLRKRLLLIIWIMILQIFALNFLPQLGEYVIYIFFAFILGRFLGIEHPKAEIDKPLDLKRKIIGWIGLVVFIISFTPKPLYFEINEKARINQPGLEKKDRDPSKIIAGRMVEIF